MDFFQPTKAHNMVALMLDPRFKDLTLVADYVGHVFAIEIATTFVNYLTFTYLMYHWILFKILFFLLVKAGKTISNSCMFSKSNFKHTC
jgi:hypothetical protein